MNSPLWPEDYGVAPNHCADVLNGSYDVPYNPATPPVILDLGANIGAFARWAVSRWPGCTVHCYEPHPSNFTLLRRTVASLPDPKAVHCHEVAVFNGESSSMLFENGFNCGEYTLLNPRNGRSSVAVTVIDAKTLPAADILKIDTEGCEPYILEALKGRLPDFNAVMLEAHSSSHVQPIIDLLAGAGLTVSGRCDHAEHRVELRFIRQLANIGFSMSDKPKFCKDCAHYIGITDELGPWNRCFRERGPKKLDVITGEWFADKGPTLCHDERASWFQRSSFIACGPNARFFQRRD